MENLLGIQQYEFKSVYSEDEHVSDSEDSDLDYSHWLWWDYSRINDCSKDIEDHVRIIKMTALIILAWLLIKYLKLMTFINIY